MLIVVLCNQKGGVGKTTTAVFLAWVAFFMRRMRVLLVDLDPQANTTGTVLGAAPASTTETIADVLSAHSDATAADVIAHTGWHPTTERPDVGVVDILPSGGDALADVAGELVGMGPGREHRLREALSKLEGDYDLVVIDSPPALDLLTVNGLAAADAVVVVTTAALFSADGIARLLRTVEAVQTYINGRLKVVGMIVNAYEARTNRQKHWMEQLVADGPAEVWLPPIQKATWIAEAIEAGIGLDELNTVPARHLAAVFDGYLGRLLAATR